MILFTEKQSFRNVVWIWFVIVAIAVLQFVLLYNKKILEPHPASTFVLLFISVINFGIILLLLIVELETSISETGILYRFFPFHLKQQTIEWAGIEKAYVRKYNPIME